jgi:hypothetical protein
MSDFGFRLWIGLCVVLMGAAFILAAIRFALVGYMMLQAVAP